MKKIVAIACAVLLTCCCLTGCEVFKDENGETHFMLFGERGPMKDGKPLSEEEAAALMKEETLSRMSSSKETPDYPRKDGISAEKKLLTLHFKNCNVSVEESSGKTVECSYDKTYYKVSQRTSKENKNKDILTVKGTEAYIQDNKNGKFNNGTFPQLKISIPKDKYELVRIRGNDAGIGLGEMNMDMEIKVKDCAFSAELSDEEQGSFSAVIIDSAASVILQTDVPANHRLVLNASDSAVSVPNSWKKYVYDKIYTRGSGEKQLRLQVKNCAFSIDTDK